MLTWNDLRNVHDMPTDQLRSHLRAAIDEALAPMPTHEYHSRFDHDQNWQRNMVTDRHAKQVQCNTMSLLAAELTLRNSET